MYTLELKLTTSAPQAITDATYPSRAFCAFMWFGTERYTHIFPEYFTGTMKAIGLLPRRQWMKQSQAFIH